MAKKSKKRQQRSKQKLVPPVNKTKKLSRLKAIFGGIVATIGVVGSLVAFWPRPVVSASDPVDLDNPFSVSFIVTNNNFIPLHDVGVSVGLGHLNTSQNINIRGASSLVQRPEWQHRHLDIDEKFTITLSDLFALRNNNKLTDSKIKIVVQYNPWILPFRREKSFTFQLKLQTNGKQYWYDAS